MISTKYNTFSLNEPKYTKLPTTDIDEDDNIEQQHPFDSNSWVTQLFTLITHSWLLQFIIPCYKDNFDQDNQSKYSYPLPIDDRITNLNEKWKYYMQNIHDENNPINCWRIMWWLEKKNFMKAWSSAVADAILHTLVFHNF